jgi:hypothetical protein
VPRFAALLPMLCLLALPTGAAAADELKPPSGADWRRHCDEYLGELGGRPKTDDLAVTYCIGLTSGVLAGLKLGSQLGAIGMASRLTAAFGLDSKQVFEEFRKTTPETLMQFCPPAGLALHDYVMLVHGYLKGHAEAAPRPLPDVFFKALQEAYPCAATPAKP